MARQNALNECCRLTSSNVAESWHQLISSAVSSHARHGVWRNDMKASEIDAMPAAENEIAISKRSMASEKYVALIYAHNRGGLMAAPCEGPRCFIHIILHACTFWVLLILPVFIGAVCWPLISHIVRLGIAYQAHHLKTRSNIITFQCYIIPSATTRKYAIVSLHICYRHSRNKGIVASHEYRPQRRKSRKCKSGKCQNTFRHTEQSASRRKSLFVREIVHNREQNFMVQIWNRFIKWGKMLRGWFITLI